jgi:hypothetical protein
MFILLMEHIVQPDESFDFEKLTLLHPIGVQGGAYFTRLVFGGKPLYIQTPQSKSRQGFVKTGKKYHCDLMFDQNAESIINWIERLEERCQVLLLAKNNDWFQNSLDKNELESAFNTTLRVFKSGRFYLMRTNVKNNTDNTPLLKLYDERLGPVVLDDVKSDNNIISIIEILGIKFTSRNFQIELELKQMMVMDQEPLFDNCLIKTTRPQYLGSKQAPSNEFRIVPYENQPITTISDNILSDNKERFSVHVENTRDQILTAIDNVVDTNTNTNNINITNDVFDKKDTEINSVQQTSEIQIKENKNTTAISDKICNTETKTIQGINFDTENELNEIQMIVADDLETISLKPPNQVYFELYKAARAKAKLAKRNVIVAYLEAKNIKKTYMLDNFDDSDSDFDAEIEEVSESELDEL